MDQVTIACFEHDFDNGKWSDNFTEKENPNVLIWIFDSLLQKIESYQKINESSAQENQTEQDRESQDS